MRKLRRITLIAFAAVIALGAILLLGVNLYVQSQGAQAKIQQELSRRLRTKLEIRSMSVTPWGGLQLSGIIIPQTSPAVPSPFLEAKTFRLRVRFLSLFSQRLVIKEVSLIKPNVVWPQDAEGRWRLPSSREVPLSGVSPRPTASVLESRKQSEFADVTATPGDTAMSGNPSSPAQGPIGNRPPGQQSRMAVAPEVRRVSIKDGSFSFLDQTGALLADYLLEVSPKDRRLVATTIVSSQLLGYLAKQAGRNQVRTLGRPDAP